ncbi:MAG: hypothetical protein AAF442_03950 [Pseudomonadota bacterium]
MTTPVSTSAPIPAPISDQPRVQATPGINDLARRYVAGVFKGKHMMGYRMALLLGLTLLGASGHGLAEEKTAYPVQTVTPTSSTSECVGDFTSVECLIDTWMACLVQKDMPRDLCVHARWFSNRPYITDEFWTIGWDARPRSYQIVYPAQPSGPDSWPNYVMVYDSVYDHAFKFYISRYTAEEYEVFKAVWPYPQIAGQDYPTGFRVIKDNEIISDCIGDLSDIVCAIDTFMACVTRQTPEACEGQPNREDERWISFFIKPGKESFYQIVEVDTYESDLDPEPSCSDYNNIYTFPPVERRHRFADVTVFEFDHFETQKHPPDFNEHSYSYFEMWYSPIGWLVHDIFGVEELYEFCFCPFPDLCDGYQ